MANGYSSSSNGSQGSRVSAQGTVAPAGYHFMPDGTLMSDAEHAKLFGTPVKKIIRSFELDLSYLNFSGASRSFTVSADEGAVFSLEIKNEDDHYYNFKTKSFQAAKTRLENKVVKQGSYTGVISFPSVTDADDYDIYLFAEAAYDTEHTTYNEVKFVDGSLDINSSTGSNSALLQKIVRQYDQTKISLSALSPLGSSDFTGTTVSASNFKTTRGQESGTVSFTITATAYATKGFSLLKLPKIDDLTAFASRTIGSAAKLIDGEDRYSVLRSAGSTVNGAVTSGVNVTMDQDVGVLWAVGDRVTGNAALDALTGAAAVTVAEVSVGGNDKILAMSEAIAIDDDETLSFYKEVYYRWPLNNVIGLSTGMFALANNITTGSYISTYSETITTTVQEEVPDGYEELAPATYGDAIHTTVSVPAIDTSGYTPTVTAGVLASQGGHITFSKKQIAALASDTVKFYGYGNDAIYTLYGTSVELSDVKIELTDVTTTTTSAVDNSTTIPVASVNGILPNRSTMGGIGIDASAVDPTVTARSATSGAGNLTVSAAQTLESGQTFTFKGAGLVATITGKIKILEGGNSDMYIYFDLDRILQGA